MNLIGPKMQAARRLTLAKKEEEDEEDGFCLKLLMEDGNSRDEISHKISLCEVLPSRATLVNWSTLDDNFLVESNSISNLGQNSGHQYYKSSLFGIILVH